MKHHGCRLCIRVWLNRIWQQIRSSSPVQLTMNDADDAPLVTCYCSNLCMFHRLLVIQRNYSELRFVEPILVCEYSDSKSKHMVGDWLQYKLTFNHKNQLKRKIVYVKQTLIGFLSVVVNYVLTVTDERINFKLSQLETSTFAIESVERRSNTSLFNIGAKIKSRPWPSSCRVIIPFSFVV